MKDLLPSTIAQFRVIENDNLICGSKNSYIATVVERQNRFTLLVEVNGKKTDTVVPALARQITKLPSQLKQSLTLDRVTELASRQKFTVATDIDVYFCDPRSPWEGGKNENIIGLLRQYLPKGSCLPSTLKNRWMRSQTISTIGHGKPWRSSDQRVSWSRCCCDRLNPSSLILGGLPLHKVVWQMLDGFL